MLMLMSLVVFSIGCIGILWVKGASWDGLLLVFISIVCMAMLLFGL